jgi:hypothetical protein
MSCHGEMAAMVAMVCGYGADFPPKFSQQILYHASKQKQCYPRLEEIIQSGHLRK